MNNIILSVIFLLNIGIATSTNTERLQRKETIELEKKADSLQCIVENYQLLLENVQKVEPRKKASKSKYSSKFLNFRLTQPLDTTVSAELKEALSDYSGPDIRITSLVRKDRRKSDHYSGRAIDFEFDESLINYLISDLGRKWLSKHHLQFYIEGRPGSHRVGKFNRGLTSEFVFYNSHARGNTGDHIHIFISQPES